MYSKSIIVLALTAASMVSAHGKVSIASGDAGGSTVALGIKGASVARFGPNAATEGDTTVFPKPANNPMTDGLGKTTLNGQLKVASTLKAAMAVANSTTCPQVSANGGVITGTWQTVTSDGTANNRQGDLFAVLDTTGTGAYSKGVQLVATSKMVGNGRGNVVQRALEAMGITKRATNVGADAKFTVKIPAGTTCTGTDPASGMTNFCLLKVANNNNAGPFGGNIAFQIAGAGAGAGAGAAPAAKVKAATKQAKQGKQARQFSA